MTSCSIQRTKNQTQTNGNPENKSSVLSLHGLFSDEIVEDFAMLGNVANRQVLDSGKAGNQEHFWECVAAAFVTEDEAFGTLNFVEDEAMAIHGHIDPRKIVPHNWKKLKKIWKAVNADYRVALAKFTQSGTHDHDFFSFCSGKAETYYLRRYLDLRPNLTATVEADLPEDTALSSVGTLSTSSNSSRSKKSPDNNVLEALREYQRGNFDSDLTKQRIISMCNEETRRTNEENRRQEEQTMKQDEHKFKKQRNMFEEWEKIQANIRSLRQDLRDDDIDIDSRNEIQEDIAALIKRKNYLAVELGLK